MSSTVSAKAILNNDSGKFGKRYIKSIAELVGNQSLLCASYQHHKLLRGQISNLFCTNSLSVFIRQFDQLIVEALKGWEHRSTVVIQDEALEVYLKSGINFCRPCLPKAQSMKDRLESSQDGFKYIYFSHIKDYLQIFKKINMTTYSTILLHYNVSYFY